MSTKKSERKNSKAAMERLLKSQFFKETISTVSAWDYYLITGDKALADEMMNKWFIARLALKHITGNFYEFSCNGETYSIVNARNHDDVLFSGLSIKGEAA